MENAMRLAILAFTVLALTGVAYAQDDNGGGGGDAAQQTADQPPAAASPDDIAPDDATSAEVPCPPGSPDTCVAAPVSGGDDDNPFANGVSLSPYDTPNGSPPPSGIVTKNGRAG